MRAYFQNRLARLHLLRLKQHPHRQETCTPINENENVHAITCLHPIAAGFTLIELICSLSIIAVLLALALAAATEWNRSNSLHSAALEVHSCVELARQTAISSAQACWFVSGVTNSAIGHGWYALSTNLTTRPAGFVHGLPHSCRFADNTIWVVRFESNGSCVSTGDVHIVIRELRPVNYMAVTILVYRTTGYATILNM